MGIERVVEFPGNEFPGWPAILQHAAEPDDPPIVRMIDGLPAFPDEVPSAECQELRIGLGGGMLTLRREGPHTLRCLAWGNADARQMAALDRVASAIAALTGGVVNGGGSDG